MNLIKSKPLLKDPRTVNILIVTEKGSPVSTQRFGTEAAIQFIACEVQVAALSRDPYTQRPLHAYVHFCSTSETYFFDLTSQSDLSLLGTELLTKEDAAEMARERRAYRKA